ncbi:MULTISPECIES: nucleotide disphospho-sugar-binding domain-containing protein [unclassified Rathayibacter]|uniref:nucleotide disphospho-sugar-binding domain-containing protein n=1 Tax=unclassified Rathayibacter TaxID=2609250 RepID=UPI00188C526F|nr:MULTISPECIES: glycosyltransferase [unclassified Rathayibacter]MBF4463066.1 glycosyltransferase family 1 protein [Rathayibacter sp. VKM Ac-2879]MBF4504697.1 glycosyltransferase family 1 protein [Rathayibacter sp. VKM Ac-2878]
MTLLIVSPDYASHLLPLATLGTAWREAGERVVVATGDATRSIVDAFAFEHVPLRLGRGSNPGTIRAEEQAPDEGASLRGFFEATRRGMVPTLAYQARERLTDLLWDPAGVAAHLRAILDEVQPEAILVDHLAFTARVALRALGVPYGDVVLGHPSALTVAGEVYGVPPEWPAALDPAPGDLAALRELCDEVRDAFTAEWNAALTTLDPSAPRSTDAFAESGDVLLLNYPEELHDPSRSALLPPHAFLGSAVRAEPVDAEVERWLASSTDPLVYVSFGSFLSVRGDVLARVVAALAEVEIGGRPVRVALASGSTDPSTLGAIPGGWLVRGFLPQVTLLGRAALAITHGGNNSVTEAMTAGVPLVALPFSTDQFAGAAALERAGFAAVLDPNSATSAELADAARRMLALEGEERAALTALSAALAGETGPRRAYTALTGAASVPR